MNGFMLKSCRRVERGLPVEVSDKDPAESEEGVGAALNSFLLADILKFKGERGNIGGGNQTPLSIPRRL